MTARVAVIGCGHVGLVVAAGLAKLGHSVVGVDRDQSLVNSLCNGEVVFHEPGLRELLAEGLAGGRLAFTTSYDRAVPESEFIFLAVDTPATTDWDEFRSVSLPAVHDVKRGDVLFDGRNVLDRFAAEAAGFAYMGIGRRFTDHRRRVTD